MKSKVATAEELILEEQKKVKDKFRLAAMEVDGENIEELFWEEYPVSPIEFIESPLFYNDHSNRIWPCIKEDMEEIFSGPHYEPSINRIVLIAGIGSGKSTDVSLIFDYYIYWILCHRSLESLYAVPVIEEPSMVFMNMAPREEQAKAIIFEKLEKAIRRTKWYGDRNYSPEGTKTFLKFPKGIIAYPGNSSSSFPVGFDVIGGVIDEATKFETMTTGGSAEPLYDELNERRESRFADGGLVAVITSAGTEESFAEKLLEEAQTDPKMFARRRSQWVANPRFISIPTFSYTLSRERPDGEIVENTLEIPIVFQRRLKLNPSKFLRNVAGYPSLTIQPYILDYIELLKNVNRKREDPCPELPYTDEGFPVPESPEDIFKRLPDWFLGEPDVWYYIHIDLGRGGGIPSLGCACGFAIAHKGPDVEREEGTLPTAVLDLSVRFKSPQDGAIKFGNVRQLIYDLEEKRNFKFAKVSLDGWESLDFMDILDARGYLTEKLSVNRAVYDTATSMLRDGRYDCFYDKHLFWELKRLEEKKTKIEPALGATKDEADSWAGVATLVVEGEIPKRKIRAKRGALVNSLSKKTYLPRTGGHPFSKRKVPGGLYVPF